MNRPGGPTELFALLTAVQAIHSVEECWFRLYDVLAPARAVAGLFSTDPAWGFAIGNALVVAAGVWTYVARVRPRHLSWRIWAWTWALGEGANGLSHITFALLRRGYFPGVITAPLLLGLSVALARRLMRQPA
ncbi:MAG: HXXEE domain-containing protein [Vicinamibacterales bacterium]